MIAVTTKRQYSLCAYYVQDTVLTTVQSYHLTLTITTSEVDAIIISIYSEENKSLAIPHNLLRVTQIVIDRTGF